MGAAHPLGKQPALAMIGLLDDDQTPSTVALRAVNASPDLPLVDVGTVTSAVFKPLMVSIPFGFPTPFVPADAATPAVDPNGYIASAALTNTVFHVRPSGAPSDAVASTPVSIAAGAIVTLVVVGVGAPSESEAGVPAARLLECIDNAGTLGNAGSCTLIATP